MSATHLTSENFDLAVSGGTVLVDFWADWCAPCRMLAPVIEELSDELDGVTVAKVDVDAEGPLAMRYSVMSIPTVILFKNGAEERRFVGVQPKAVFAEALRQY